MRTYADTSFLVRLLTEEAGTAAAVGLYRGLGRPPLFFLPLHALEVGNAIRQRAFHQFHTKGRSDRVAIRRERDASLALLDKFISRRVFAETSVDLAPVIETARGLSEKHTERLACRGFDLLHVALALELESEMFLTVDHIQGALARAEGLDVTLSTDE